jgi:4-carboxymuconolactone decarboxylase
MKRAMDSGMGQPQLAKVIAPLGFYAGWPRAMSALPAAKAVLAARLIQRFAHPTCKRAELSVFRAGSQPSANGAEDYFIGSMKVDSRFQQVDPARIGGGVVTFEPGTRTGWHTHPLGQTLIVTEGRGWMQRESDPIEDNSGDIVWIPPNPGTGTVRSPPRQ